MAISRSVGRRTVSVAEAHLARVAAEGSSRHRHVIALLEASGRIPAATSPTAVHLLCSLHGVIPSLIELAIAIRPTGLPAIGSPSRRRIRARAPVPCPADVGGRPAAQHARRGRDRSQPERPAPRAGDPRDVGASRLCARRRRSAGRRLVADPPHAGPCRVARRLDCPAARPSRRSVGRRRSSSGVGHAASERALAFGGEQCCSSTAPCSTCSKPAPKPAATTNRIGAPAEAGRPSLSPTAI